MDDEELGAQAKTWVNEEIARLRRLSYDVLLERLDKPLYEGMRTSSGKALERETQVFWDGGKGGPVRVMVAVWGPRGARRHWSRGTRPLSIDDFIRAPDGTFVGEGTDADVGPKP